MAIFMGYYVGFAQCINIKNNELKWNVDFVHELGYGLNNELRTMYYIKIAFNLLSNYNGWT